VDFDFSEEQQMLRDGIARYVQQEYTFEKRQRIVRDEGGFSASHWRQFAQLGWLQMLFREEHGGLGGTAVDLIALMEPLGQGLVLEPFVATAVLGGGLIAATGTDAQRAAWLAPLMQGELQLAFAYAEQQSRYTLADVITTASRRGEGYVVNGRKTVVLNGGLADRILVSVRTAGERRDRDGISLLLVDGTSVGLQRIRYQTVNGDQAAELVFHDVTVPAEHLLGVEGAALPAIEQAIDRATLAICAEAVGAMEVLYRRTVEYSRLRKQFGVPIGSFQALQHRMVEMFIEHEQARSLLLMAAMRCDSAGAPDARSISALKSRAGKAARHIGQEAIQIHGGIGITEELDVGHYFKRLTTIQNLFGSTDLHTLRFAQAPQSS
jgi:alkylation response protein AidB-like acyl-CoA dehydrogenase